MDDACLAGSDVPSNGATMGYHAGAAWQAPMHLQYSTLVQNSHEFGKGMHQ